MGAPPTLSVPAGTRAALPMVVPALQDGGRGGRERAGSAGREAGACGRGDGGGQEQEEARVHGVSGDRLVNIQN
jgi:hypothetical protein